MAIKYTDDENQLKMINSYIEFFDTGNFSKFEESQYYSLNTKCPIIEFYLGWVNSNQIRSKFIVNFG